MPRGDDPLPAIAPRMAEAIAYSVDAGILRAEHYLHLRCEVPAADCISRRPGALESA